MKKLLVVCGPTAIGKTSLALDLAEKFYGELVSADSRQVYKWMDIGTGKDLPVNVKCQMSNVKWRKRKLCYYKINAVKLWGYDLVEPTEEFSVAQYIGIVRVIIENIWKRGKLPILVGGTGFYIKGIIDGIPTSSIPKNIKLRSSLEEMSVNQLYDLLARLDPTKAGAMNLSDRKNPRRLIRAIEVAHFQIRRGGIKKAGRITRKYDCLFVGLKQSKGKIEGWIKKRVEKRMKLGIESEIKMLFKKGITWQHQSMEALGYCQWRGYFTGKKKKEDVINNWLRDEVKYAKRQMTWFKKDKRINWYTVGKKGWKNGIEMLISTWYSTK